MNAKSSYTAVGLVANTLHTASPDVPKTPEAGSIGVCVHHGDLCVAIFADHGRQEIIARLTPVQADHFCSLLAEAMREVKPAPDMEFGLLQMHSGGLLQ